MIGISSPNVKRNNEVDTRQERSPYSKCGKPQGRACRRGSNACYSCSKLGHMMKDCPYMRGQKKGKEKIQSNCPSEEVLRR